MGARPKLLVTRRIFPEVLERLEAHFEVASNQSDDEWSAEDLRARVADRDALFVVASDRVDAALLDAAPKLRIVSTGSVGYNHIDLAACSARGPTSKRRTPSMARSPSRSCVIRASSSAAICATPRSSTNETPSPRAAMPAVLTVPASYR